MVLVQIHWLSWLRRRGSLVIIIGYPEWTRGALIGMFTLSTADTTAGRCVRLSSRLLRLAASMSRKKSKESVEGPPPLLGRVGTSLKCGIVGLPNVG